MRYFQRCEFLKFLLSLWAILGTSPSGGLVFLNLFLNLLFKSLSTVALCRHLCKANPTPAQSIYRLGPSFDEAMETENIERLQR